jgi:hypothetical protein
LTVIVSADNKVRTDREIKFQKYLDFIGISYVTNPYFCFNCKDYYLSTLSLLNCPVCKQNWRETGKVCIPDFLLTSPLYTPSSEFDYYSTKAYANKHPKAIGVIMINEAIHYKNKRAINKLAAQIKALMMDANLRVFPISDYEIDDASHLQLLGMAYYISHAVNNRNLYDTYVNTNEFKEKTGSFYSRCT